VHDRQLGRAIEAGESPQGCFLNGGRAFVLSNSMIVLTGRAEFGDFDFFQSSNRIAIEYLKTLALHSIQN
jgi:hypothetical protein